MLKYLYAERGTALHLPWSSFAITYMQSPARVSAYETDTRLPLFENKENLSKQDIQYETTNLVPKRLENYGRSTKTRCWKGPKRT